ncbi:MAG: flagellar basal body protein, partial [Gemmatimonadota bacterium]
MTTLRGIVNSARTLAYYTRLQEVTANNLANGSTDGFKVDRMTANRIKDVDSLISIEQTDLSQGSLRITGRPLDVGLEGEGYLVVDTPRG